MPLRRRVGYAWLLRERDGRNAIPLRVGAVNPQTAWVLKTVKLEAPHYMADASPTFGRIMRTLPPILPDRPCAKRGQLPRRVIRARPLWTPMASHSDW